MGDNMNESTIWDFLKSKGLNEFAIAGVMGNLYAESALSPTNLQNSYNRSLGYTDDGYTNAVDKGTYGNFVHDSAGYGLAQWTHWSRKDNLLKFARKSGKSIGDLEMQLEFFWNELSGYANVMRVLRTATSVFDASTAVLLWYERPADQSETAKKRRAGYGQKYYDQFASKNASEMNEETSTTKEELDYGYYEVRSGDTLSTIAAKYGTTYQNLAKMNDIENPDIIRVGQKIKVPVNQVADPKIEYYTVKAGDTLSRIAARYGTDYRTLAKMNAIENPNHILVGQRIRVK